MICSQCGQPQLPGARRCPACGSRVSAPGAIAYTRSGAGGRVFAVWAVLTVVGAIALFSLPGLLSSPLHRVARRMEDLVSPSTPARTTTTGTAPPASGPTTSRSSAVVAATTAALPPGPHVTVTQAELNDAIVRHAADIKPVDHATVEIVQDGLNVDFGAYGMSGHYHGRVSVVDGVPIVTAGKIDGVLGLFVSPTELESALNSEIGAAVAQQHVVVNQVIARPGQLVFYTQQ